MEEMLKQILIKLEGIEKKINKIENIIEEFEKETENFSPEKVSKYISEFKL